MRQQRPMPNGNGREDEDGAVQTLPAPTRPTAPRPQRPEQPDADLVQVDPFVESPLASRSNAASEELEGMEELGQQLNWVSLEELIDSIHNNPSYLVS